MLFRKLIEQQRQLQPKKNRRRNTQIGHEMEENSINVLGIDDEGINK